MPGGGSEPGERRGGRQAGTPNKATREVRELARKFGPDAIKQIAALAGLKLADDGTVTTCPDGAAESEQARIAALNILLDRAYGKAAQPLTGEDGDGEPAFQVRRIELVAVTREEVLARQEREREQDHHTEH